MPNFFPDASQPLNTFFSITMGGLDKIYTGSDTQGYANPNIPVDFSFVQSEGGESIMTVTFFDETGYEVEPYIAGSFNSNPSGYPGGTFQFGYTQPAGVVSEVINFDIANYSVQVLDESFAITLVSTPILGIHLSTNQISGTIEQILDRIQQLYPKLQIVKSHEPGTEYMLESNSNSVDDTAPREIVHSKLAQETDMAFIRRVIENYYIGQDGVAGFRVYTSSQDGQPVLYIARPSDGSAQYKYVVRSKEGPVIKWNPNLCFDNVTWNSNGNMVNGIQKHTGDTYTTPLDQTLTQSYQIAGSQTDQTITSTPKPDKPNNLHNFASETMDSSVKGSGVRAIASPSRTSLAGLNTTLCEHIRSWQTQVNAELTIVGDPSILINVESSGMPKVEIEFAYPQNYRNNVPTGLHYTSDNYNLVSVAHNIRNGEYTTTLGLFCPGLTNWPPEQPS